MALTIIKPGPLTLIQDGGRIGYQHFGITQGGPMDEHAYYWANTLLANPVNSAQLEITLGGFLCEFSQETTIALCGADLGATLNGKLITPWQTYRIHAGDQLALSRPHSGIRTYLAVEGGFDVPLQWGSCATVAREGLGGLYQCGNPLVAGDQILYSGVTTKKILKQVPEHYIPRYSSATTLRLLVNTSDIGVDEKIRQQFLSQTYRISPQSDRMGYRLQGSPVYTNKQNVISHGLPFGAIQLPPDGQPIILMKDHQTMGGYPLVGCVARLDLPQLAQASVNDQICFIAASIDDLAAVLKAQKRFFTANS